MGFINMAQHERVRLAYVTGRRNVERVFEGAGYDARELQEWNTWDEARGNNRKAVEILKDGSHIADLLTGTYWIIALYQDLPAEVDGRLSECLMSEMRDLPTGKTIDDVLKKIDKTEPKE